MLFIDLFSFDFSHFFHLQVFGTGADYSISTSGGNYIGWQSVKTIGKFLIIGGMIVRVGLSFLKLTSGSNQEDGFGTIMTIVFVLIGGMLINQFVG